MDLIFQNVFFGPCCTGAEVQLSRKALEWLGKLDSLDARKSCSRRETREDFPAEDALGSTALLASPQASHISNIGQNCQDEKHSSELLAGITADFASGFHCI